MDVAFYDRTFRGRLIITGRDRLALLHRLATNSLLTLEKGKGCETCKDTGFKGRLGFHELLVMGDALRKLTEEVFTLIIKSA